MKHTGYIALLAIMIICSPYAFGRENKFPFRGEVLAGYDEDKARERCDAMDLQTIEGIWYYPDEDMTVMIERCDDSKPLEYRDYRMVLVSSDDLSLLPGTVIGYCKPTVSAQVYKMWIYAEKKDSVLENLLMCKATVNAVGDEITVERSKVDLKVRVNFSRFLPRLLGGISVTTTGVDNVEVPEGLRKVYPKSAKQKKEVRYL